MYLFIYLCACMYIYIYNIIIIGYRWDTVRPSSCHWDTATTSDSAHRPVPRCRLQRHPADAPRAWPSSVG